jgi:hypothetical protein
VSVEDSNPAGDAVRVPNPRGLLALDGAGLVFEAVVRGDRTRPTEDTKALTDAQRGGRRRQDDHVTRRGCAQSKCDGQGHHAHLRAERRRLTITSVGVEAHQRAATRWVWERVPPVENLSPRFVGYFGAIAVYPGQVFHHILGGVSPQGPTTLKRFFDLALWGDEVNLRFPVTRNPQGEEMTTLVTMKRLSGERDMLAGAAR